MNYEREAAALRHALKKEQKYALAALRSLSEAELDLFVDALDWLAAYADAETIRRAEKRP